MPTPVANKNRAGLMGPEHIKQLDGKLDQAAVTSTVNTAVAVEATARNAAIATAADDAVRRALNHTIWMV